MNSFDPTGECIGLDDTPCSDYAKDYANLWWDAGEWGSTAARSIRFFVHELQGAALATPRLLKSTYDIASHPIETWEGLKQFGAAVAADPVGMARRGGNAIVNAEPGRAAEFVGEALFFVGASAALKTPEAVAVASRVGTALNDTGVKAMLRVTKGASWRAYYDSFAPGTARLRFTFGRRTLYRGANSKGAAVFGEFASVERPLSPVLSSSLNRNTD